MVPNILLIGNTGVGKSYLLNSLGASFDSGFSTVNGLTAECNYLDVTIGESSVRLIDAPGLLEATGRKMIRNADAITQALSMRGVFKVIFVLPECAGRVNPSDLYTIGKVMSAIDFSIDVGVIINKVPDEDMKLYQNNTARNRILEQLNGVAGGKIKSSWFMVIPRFRRGEEYGPAPFVLALLNEMTYQHIPKVRDIAASMQEFNQFMVFMKTVRKLLPEVGAQWFKGLAQEIVEGQGDKRYSSLYGTNDLQADRANGVIGAPRDTNHADKNVATTQQHYGASTQSDYAPFNPHQNRATHGPPQYNTIVHQAPHVHTTVQASGSPRKPTDRAEEGCQVEEVSESQQPSSLLACLFGP